ncbi:4-aminobutyrate--pyruvate transaminase [Collimonas sp. PA-H2]|uniref:aminotransferase n=1 Tax=Collimonas sp. PA-H2 TaxID=1881062 RepID=UPI000BF3260E|nr:aminotransferase [Collimonas sp. PA-H2]PFH11195.1 4-aminobutyrate--pyruvate transaminase [Collimonas sp. PA-H2]
MSSKSNLSLGERDMDAMFHPTTHIQQHRAKGSKVFTHAEGIHIWDENQNQYIEGMSGLWCTAVGYGEKELSDAAARQMNKLSYSHLFNGRSNEPAILLAEKLKEMAPFAASKVFFGHSGSDANDTQIKLAWYYNNALGRPRKKKIISRQRSYHGVGFGSASMTGLASSHTGFDLPFAPFLRTRCPDYYREAEAGESEQAFSSRLAEELESLILAEDPDTIAAFIAEPLMGAGGVVVPPQGYFEKIQIVLDRYDILLIDDEVICGFGRTGKMFGAETFHIRPDTMSLAKALSSGYQPISAVLIPEKMYQAFLEASGSKGIFGHGFTYSGHPVCAAVALRNIELIEERGLVPRAEHLGVHFQSRLRDFSSHPLVGDARGVGLIGALELVADKKTKKVFSPGLAVGADLQARCEQYGLIVRALGDTIAFCPPLIITEAQIDEIFDRFGRALDETLSHFRHKINGA